MSAPDNFPQIMHNAKKKKAVTASTTGVISLKARGRSFIYSITKTPIWFSTILVF